MNVEYLFCRLRMPVRASLNFEKCGKKICHKDVRFRLNLSPEGSPQKYYIKWENEQKVVDTVFVNKHDIIIESGKNFIGITKEKPEIGKKLDVTIVAGDAPSGTKRQIKIGYLRDEETNVQFVLDTIKAGDAFLLFQEIDVDEIARDYDGNYYIAELEEHPLTGSDFDSKKLYFSSNNVEDEVSCSYIFDYYTYASKLYRYLGQTTGDGRTSVFYSILDI